MTNLKTSEYTDYDLIINNKSDPILKLTVKYRNHLRILAIAKVCKKSQNFPFLFSLVQRKNLSKEIQNLDINKVAQESDIPCRAIKENSNISGDFLLSSLNDAIKYCYFPIALK